MTVGMALLYLGGFTVKFVPGFSIQTENTHGLMRHNTFTVYYLHCRQYLHMVINLFKQTLWRDGPDLFWTIDALQERPIHWYLLVYCRLGGIVVQYVFASLLQRHRRHPLSPWSPVNGLPNHCVFRIAWQPSVVRNTYRWLSLADLCMTRCATYCRLSTRNTIYKFE